MIATRSSLRAGIRISTTCAPRARNRLLASIAALVLISLSLPASGEDAWVHFDNNADIRALFERNDTLWVGTNGGLIVVDRNTGEVFTKISAGQLLADNSVRTITSKRDSILVGTDEGLSILMRDRSQVLTRHDWQVYQAVRSVAFSPEGHMYVGTYGFGVGAHLPDGRVHITTVDSLLDDKVYAISVLDSGDAYYATSLGLCAYRDSVWVSYQAGAGLPRGEVKSLVHVGEPTEPLFYVLVAGRGIYRFDGRRARRIKLGETFPEADVAAIDVDAKGAVWAAGRFGSIARYANGRWQTYGDDDPAIAGAKWRTCHVAGDGGVFFGSADGLIAVVEDGALRKISLASTLPSGYVGDVISDATETLVVNGRFVLSWDARTGDFTYDSELGSVFATAVSPRGAIWAATPWGLLRREGGEWRAVPIDTEPSAPVVVSLTFDSWGNLWVGMHNGEVYRYDGEVWIRMAERDELGATTVDDIVVDHLGQVWAVSRTEGAYRYDGQTWTSYDRSHFDSLPIEAAIVGGDGRVLLLTERHLWRFGIAGAWAIVPVPSTTDVGSYRTLHLDSAGRLFLGTSDGLVVLEDGQAQWHPARGGLRGRDVTTVWVDGGDRVWVGFRRDGLARTTLARLVTPAGENR